MSAPFVMGKPCVVYEVDSSETGHSSLLLTEKDHLDGGKKSRKILIKERRWQIAKNMREGGLDEAASLEEAGVSPQGRLLLPISESNLRVARAGSKCNERFAMVVRHFPAADVQPNPGLLALVRAASVQVGCMLAEIFRDTVGSFTNVDLNGVYPHSWTAERAQAVRTKLACTFELTSRDTTRKFFVKANEALCKYKARLIQAMSDVVALLQCWTVRLLGDVMFSCKCCLGRSIKYIPADELPRRMMAFLARFKSGRILSVDFASWDSTIRNLIRENLENVAMATFFDNIVSGSRVIDMAMKDRSKKKLIGESVFFKISAEVFGRESGDGGTSTLNFLTNFVLSLVLEQAVLIDTGKTADIGKVLRYRIANTAWMDSFHEGDDSVFAFGPTFINMVGGLQPLMRKVTGFYGDLGLKIEPACNEGVTVDPVKALQPYGGRLEFVSRLFVLGDVPFSIPLVPRTVRAASVTFTKGDVMTAAFSGAVSGRLTSCSSPLLRSLYSLLQRAAAQRGGKLDSDLTGYRARELLTASRLTVDEKLVQLLGQASATDARARLEYEREYSMSVADQIALEGRLDSYEVVDDGSWGEVSRLLADIFAAC